MTETPQHPSQNPYGAGPAAQDDGAPQPSPFPLQASDPAWSALLP